VAGSGGCTVNVHVGSQAAIRLAKSPAIDLAEAGGKRGTGMSDFMRVYSAEDIKAIVAYLSSVD
jgi:hypothetical protein